MPSPPLEQSIFEDRRGHPRNVPKILETQVVLGFQCLKQRCPVKSMAMPARSQAAMTSASFMLPPG